MGNTKIKIWFAAFVLTLATAGGAASYAAQEQMFYKGTERVEAGIGAIGQASVLDAPVIASEPRHSEPPLREDKLREGSPSAPPVIASEPRHPEPPLREDKLREGSPSAPKAKPTPSPCATDNTIVFKDGKFAGCKSACEAEGKHTYVGPDRPGLLYGRCIECDTATFLINGGTCNFNS